MIKYLANMKEETIEEGRVKFVISPVTKHRQSLIINEVIKSQAAGDSNYLEKSKTFDALLEHIIKEITIDGKVMDKQKLISSLNMADEDNFLLVSQVVQLATPFIQGIDQEERKKLPQPQKRRVKEKTA